MQGAPYVYAHRGNQHYVYAHVPDHLRTTGFSELWTVSSLKAKAQHWIIGHSGKWDHGAILSDSYSSSLSSSCWFYLLPLKAGIQCMCNVHRQYIIFEDSTRVFQWHKYHWLLRKQIVLRCYWHVNCVPAHFKIGSLNN